MYRVRKQFTFEMAHMLDKAYTEECRNIHGHSYILEVFLMADVLNSEGMVIDFKLLKEIVEPCIRKFDHSFVYNKFHTGEYKRFVGCGKIIPFHGNPTAENMAIYFYEQIHTQLQQNFKDSCLETRVRLEKIRLHETATGWAEYWR